ncbi:DUF2156 domain-containing protein [Arthrobacter sp. M2012083]|uniref:bifunctional lysylphosphatidylglycerol flippase/synthetase MprF n=1 Tax=Arthrobacter sp. M2012083 TaxID=1197706 RepID=UPI001ED95132|nr:DUF2156 domain-containing protein [Arthrobacter sp. M2012083]
MLFLAVSTGSLANGPSPALLAMVGIVATDPASSWWALVTSAFFATSWLDYLIQIVVVVVGVGIAEHLIGPWKALLAFLAGCVLSSLALIGLFLAGTSSADEWVGYFSGDFVVGAYGGTAAALGAATASLNILWRRRLRTWLLALAVMFALYVGVAQSLQLLVGALAGVLGGRMLGTGDRQTTKAGVFSSPRESRFLIATIVGVFAVGPLLTQLTSSFAMGPLSTVGALSLQNPPDTDEMKELCGGDSSCVDLQDTVGTNSAGAVILSIIPLLLLLLCSEGLRRGRRLALWIALVINVIFSAVVLMRLVAFLISSGLEKSSGILMLYVLPAALIPAAIGALLLITRGRFRAGSGPEATRSMFQAVAILTAAVITAYTIFWCAEGNLERGTLGDLLLQLTHVVIPFPVPFHVQLPLGFMTTLIYGFGGAVIWMVFAILAFRNFILFNLGGRGGDEQRGQVRTLLKRGGGSLSWMALWGNNRYWFSPDGQAGVAYQLHNGVALTVAGPFGAPEAQIEATRSFVAYSLELGLTPCFYSASSDLGVSLEGMDFHALEVAEETLLNIENMSFNGREWQNVRTALNRADKLGIKDQWHRYPTMPPRLRAQLAEISEEWIADKSLPEMGFTMGGLDELKDEDVLCCVAVDREGLVHGVTSWLPVYTEGHITSWTLDFMRRRTTGFKGVMEFLIASAVTHFKTDVPTISLSGSPLADFGDPTGSSEEDAPAVVKILGMFRDALEPMYGFKSLSKFKSRFQPEYRTLYMYYQDPLALPFIGLAITAAYLPGLSAKQGTTIVKQMMAKEPVV